MINSSALSEKPVLVGDRVRLVPLTDEHTDAYFASTLDAEVRRLTGIHRSMTYEQARAWCASRPQQADRLDMAILDASDGRFLGEASLHDVHRDNQTAAYRIALSAIEFTGLGLGKDATRLLLGYAFDRIGLHRVWLYVYAFNMRAIAAYRDCGFRVEGRLRDSLFWEGRRHDALLMGVLEGDFRAACG